EILHSPRRDKGCEALPTSAAGHPSDRAARRPVCWIFRGGAATRTPSKERHSNPYRPPKHPPEDNDASRRGDTTPRRLQRLASGEAGIGVMPEADLVLVQQPAQVDLLAVADRREVDQAAVDVTQHDVDRFELPDRPAQLDQRLR